MDTTTWLWVGFGLFVCTMLALDLGVFHRKAHVVTFKEAATWVGVWVALAVLFGIGVTFLKGSEAGTLFFTGYVVEQSLSVDNVFLFAVIFTFFRVPMEYRHRVLFWGILGALIMRAAMIFAGAALLERFHWVIYVFGGFLILTGIKMFRHRDEEVDPSESWVLRLTRRLIPVSTQYDGQRFFTRIDGKLFATPLFLVLVLIEFTDLVFAVDSIPAVFAIFPNPANADPFIIYTSNVFAILGLRSLYFMLSGVMEMFHYLKVGLAFVLVFVGFKMLVATYLKIPSLVSLAVILGIIGVAIAASIVRSRRLEPSSEA